MASKEEIEKRVEQEGARVYGVFIERIQESAAQGITRGVRPLVERVIELEEEATKHTALTVKLASAEEHVIEQGRTIEVLNSDRSRILADLTEARASLRTAHAELRTATREHDETTAALRAQVAALQGVIDGHEQAIKDACADVRASLERSVNDARAEHHRAVQRCDRLATTVDVLAGRLAARGA